MRIRSAAALGLVGVIVYLITHVIACLLYLGPMIEAATRGAFSPIYLLGSLLNLVGGLALGVGVLVVLVSLSRTTEDLLRDNPDM